MNGKQALEMLTTAVAAQTAARRTANAMIAEGLRMQAAGLPALAAKPELRAGLVRQAEGFEMLARSEESLGDVAQRFAAEFTRLYGGENG